MKSTSIALAGLVLALAMQAQAVFIPTYMPPPVRNEPGNQKEDDNSGGAAIMTALSITTIGMGGQLYNSAGADGLFSLLLSDPQKKSGAQTAQLTYIGAGPMPTLTYIIVKAGDTWTIWDASDWMGSEIQVDNRDLMGGNGKGRGHGPKLHGISQVGIFGATNGECVPDGGLTAVLLGMALLGVGSLKKVLSS